MDERTAPALPKEMNERYEEAIRKNLTELMHQRGISQSQLAQIFYGHRLPRGTAFHLPSQEGGGYRRARQTHTRHGLQRSALRRAALP